MSEFNWNVFPDGGRKFVDRDGTIHKGESWRHLFEQIRRYREINKFAPGDPEVEVSAQLCAKMPHLCRPNAPHVPPNHHSQSHSQSHNQRVLQWYSVQLSRKRLHAIPRVEDSVAADRAAICARCPRQQALNAACEACISSVKTSRKVILDGRESQHQNLSPCSALGEDCTVSVHIEQAPEAEPSLPAECWRRKSD
jgi:hypothetical protein